MDLSDNESEKTEILFRFDLPLILNSLSIPHQASISPQLQNTFQTLQNTQQIPVFESPDSLLSPETITGIIKFLQTQNFQDIELIGKGGYGLVFKARNVIRDEIIALKLQLTFKGEETFGGQEEANLGKFLSKKVAENLNSKTLSIYSKLLFNDPQGKYVLTIIEMELAKYSLRDLITSRRKEGKALKNKELRKICFDLLENLYFIHLNKIAHFDIKPENVLFINMNESYILADFGISEEITGSSSNGIFMTPMKGSPLYMSPKMKEAFCNQSPMVSHDPFKSDIYSLGLIFLELNTVSNLTDEQFTNCLRLRNHSFRQLISEHPMFLTFNYLFQEEECYKIPDILGLMLTEKEDDRKDVLEICLACDLIEPILSGISTPLSQRFLPNISSPPLGLQEVLGFSNSKDFEKCNKMISYVSRPVIYIGDYKSYMENPNSNTRHYKKEGKGILLKIEDGGPSIAEITKNNYRDYLIFEGFWKDDIPTNFGILKFNNQGTYYEGEFNQGRFHGKGNLFIRGIKTKSSFWFCNLPNDFRHSLCLEFANNLEPGYYKFYTEEEKVCIKKKKVKIKGIDFFFDLINLNIEAKLVLFFIELMCNRLEITKIKFKQKIDSPFINQPLDILKLEGRDYLFDNSPKKFIIFLNSGAWNNSKLMKSSNQLTSLKNPISAFEILRSQIMKSTKILKIIGIPYGDEFFNEILLNKSLICPLEQLKITRNDRMTDFVFRDLPILSTIISLDLSQTKISDESLRRISVKDGVKVVESLNLSFCRNISSEGIKFVMQSPGMKNLRILNLDSCLINDEAIEHFGKSPFVKNLSILKLSHCSKLMDHSLKSLALSENSKSLMELNLSYLHFTELGVGQLATSKNLQNLQKLLFMKCAKITNEGLMKLLQNLKRLEVLNIGRSKFTSKIAPKISLLKNLSFLKLKKCSKISDDFFEALVDSSAVKPLQMKSLDVGFTAITGKFIDDILKSSFFNQLTSLKIPGCANLKENSFINLVMSGIVKRLKILDVSDTVVGDDFLISLGNEPEFQLVSLKMNNCNRLSLKGIQAFFTSKFPKIYLKFISLQNSNGFDCFQELSAFEVLDFLDLKGCKIIDFNNFNHFLDSFLSKVTQKSKNIKIDFGSLEFPKEIINKLEKMKPITLNVIAGSSKSSLLALSASISQEITEKSHDLTDEMLKSISNSECLKNLSELNLSRCTKITDKGFSLIMNSKNCKNLEKIDLSFTNLTDLSLKSLVSNPFGNLIQSLVLYNNDGITYSGMIECLKAKKIIKLRKFDARIKKKTLEVGSIQNLFETLCSYPAVSALAFDFSSQKFPENLYTFKNIFLPLKSFKEMKEFEVNFSSCKFNEEQILQIIEICEYFTEMETMKIDFSGSLIQNNGCEKIGKSIKVLKKLKKVEISLKK